MTADSPSPALIRVLLVDDQELVRAGLRGILRERFGFDVVGECADGSGVPAAVKASHPDVVLMDVRMPAVDGVTTTRQLTAAGAGTGDAAGAAGAGAVDAAGDRAPGTQVPPVLALTTFDDDEALAGMLRAGAAGFILKGVSAEELQRAVRIVAEGGAWLDPAVTGRVLAAYREGPARKSIRSAALDMLTAREREVLALIGAGRTNAEIAAALFVGEGTVKSHVNHVFTKLSLRDRAAAVIFALDHGLTAPGSGDG